MVAAQFTLLRSADMKRANEGGTTENQAGMGI